MHMKQNVKSDGRKDSPIHDSVSVLLGRVVVVGGGRLLPYIDYTGMCRCTGYGFPAFLSRTRYRKHAF